MVPDSSHLDTDEALLSPLDLPSAAASIGKYDEIMQPALLRLALLAAIFSYAWFLAGLVAGDRGANWWPSFPPLTLGSLAVIAFLNASRYRLAATALIVGFSCAAIADELVLGGALDGWLFLTSTLVAGVLAGPVMGMVVGIGLSASIFAWAPWPDAWPSVRAALTGSLLVWAAGGSIFQTLVRAQASEMRAWQQAAEAMKRRGELRGVSKALHDMYALLERTNHELEIARREAEEAKEIKARFAANISHELRTPLNLILGFSRIMHRSPSVYGGVNWTPELRADVRQIYNASRHLLGMIDDILDLSRIEAQRLPLRLEPVDPTLLLDEAAATARGLLRDSSVTLVVNVPPSLPELVLDRTRIRQVLLNLLSNAIRFTDRGQITLSAWGDESNVHVSVSDTGIGIAAEDLPTIFDEFSQVGAGITDGRGGAGLGLAVCKQFVQLHGGHITVESQVGKGSTFHFNLPISQPWSGRRRLAYYLPEGWSPPLPDNPLAESIVVLGPDESAARVIAKGVLGCRVLLVRDIQALAAVVESEHPLGVVIVKDPLAMGEGPQAEDVWQCTGRPDLGVIECELPLEETARCLLNVDAYLTKPVSPDEIATTIRRINPSAVKLLAVDDDAGFLALLERMLHLALPEASLYACSDGEQALQLARQEAFDLVILDLIMPRLSGAEFLQRLREEGLLAGAGFIVTTGAPYVEELAAALPTKLHFARKSPPRSDHWLQCISAILAAAPVDYSVPAHRSELAATPRL